MSKDGFRHFLVSNVQELEVLLMHNQTYAATVGGCVSCTDAPLCAMLSIKFISFFLSLRIYHSMETFPVPVPFFCLRIRLRQ